MNTWITRAGATVTAAALVGLVGGPAAAAAPVARATAGAVVVSVGGNLTTGSGTYQVTNDGTSQETNGTNKPAITALGGQSFLSTGTLAQDAETSVVDGAGQSVACAGLAGDGASVVSSGDSRCLVPGSTLSLQAASLDLSSLQIVSSGLFAGLDSSIQAQLAPLLTPLTNTLQTTLQTTLTQLGDIGIFLDLGAVQATCAASPGAAVGDADLADVGAFVKVGSTRVDLISLPARPAPNTPVVTGLDEVAATIEDALRQQLNTALTGALAPVSLLVDQAAVLNQALAQISTQLAPLEQTLLRGTLNKQTKPTADSISVTALDLEVLPVAQSFVDDSLVHLTVGNVSCGPGGRVAAPAAASPTPKPTPTPTPQRSPQPTAVPTSIPAGVDQASPGGEGDSSPLGTGALAAVLVLAAGAGIVSYRRGIRS